MYGEPRNPHNLPSLASLKQLSPPEIGLRMLDIWRREDRIRTLPDFARGVAQGAYDASSSLEAALLLMEGLSYLAREGLLVRDPGQSSDFYTLPTRSKA